MSDLTAPSFVGTAFSASPVTFSFTSLLKSFSTASPIFSYASVQPSAALTTPPAIVPALEFPV